MYPIKHRSTNAPLLCPLPGRYQDGTWTSFDFLFSSPPNSPTHLLATEQAYIRVVTLDRNLLPLLASALERELITVM